jgi:hypothetical protein
LAAGQHEVTVEYLNDFKTATEDRNLIVKKIEYAADDTAYSPIDSFQTWDEIIVPINGDGTKTEFDIGQTFPATATIVKSWDASHPALASRTWTTDRGNGKLIASVAPEASTFTITIAASGSREQKLWVNGVATFILIA